MAYKKFVGRTETYQKQDNTLISRTQTLSRQPEEILFYEFEPAVVVDVILDENHDIIKSKKKAIVDEEEWPIKSDGTPHEKSDVDYSWIGRAKVRLIITEEGIKKEQLNWALPLETNIKEYPLINEIVIVVKYLNNFYYTRKLNAKNFINHNADFRWEIRYGLKSLDNDGTISTTSAKPDENHIGSLGKYFKSNDRIRPLKHFEGDTVLESRHGSSIRFGCFVGDPSLDIGGSTIDYGPNPNENEEGGHGNPMVLIRNRQRVISRKKNDPEHRFNGNILEDINSDGSSIHITSGLTTSGWKTTCLKKHFEEVLEEQPDFSPKGSTPFKFPTLNGEQIVINTDRIVIASRSNETLHFSKKRYAIITDNEYTVDAHQQIVLTTNTKTVVNSPFIYLGQYNETKEPVLLGQTTIEWLYDLCEWLKSHTHWYHHTHPDPQGGNVGDSDEPKTQVPVQIAELVKLQNRLPSLLSRRVFVTGGGYAPGRDGGEVKGLTEPGKIPNIPGGFYGNVPRIKGDFPWTILASGGQEAASSVAQSQSSKSKISQTSNIVSKDGSPVTSAKTGEPITSGGNSSSNKGTVVQPKGEGIDNGKKEQDPGSKVLSKEKSTTQPSTSEGGGVSGKSTTTGSEIETVQYSDGTKVSTSKETMTGVNDGKDLGTRTGEQTIIENGDTTVIQQKGYSSNGRDLPDSTIQKNSGGFKDDPNIISGTATTFGKGDSEDQGFGSPSHGLVQTNSDVQGVAIRDSEMKSTFGPNWRNDSTAQSAMVEVYNPKTNTTARVPIVDSGPGNPRASIDLTKSTEKAIGANGSTPVQHRIVVPDGNGGFKSA